MKTDLFIIDEILLIIASNVSTLDCIQRKNIRKNNTSDKLLLQNVRCGQQQMTTLERSAK